MVFLRSFLIFVVILMSGIPCFCESTWLTKDGYYIDSRGEYERSYIKPPHPENIPKTSKVIQPTVDFDSYYNINVEGYRGREDKLPVSPAGYTQNYSTRKAQLYTKEDYINVWCDGKKHAGKVDCLTDTEAISFFPISAWSRGITTAAWRARHYSQKGVAALYVEDTASITGDMYQAKEWAKKWGAKVVFISIDAGIPQEWIN